MNFRKKLNHWFKLYICDIPKLDILNWSGPFEKLLEKYKDLDAKAQKITRWAMTALVVIMLSIAIQIISISYQNFSTEKVIYRTDTIKVPVVIHDTVNVQSIISDDNNKNTQYNTNIGQAEKVYH